MKYARIERERRFLLARVPPEVDPGGPFKEIRDRYIVGTHLRLREVRSTDGSPPIYKFTQKLLGKEPAATRRQITNTYLEAHEHALLSGHPANTLVKRRHPLVHEGTRYAIDRFLGDLEGLVLAEVDAESDKALARIPHPPFAALEVTAREEFTGGALAAASPPEVLALAKELVARSRSG